jgi:hypothetical protein
MLLKLEPLDAYTITYMGSEDGEEIFEEDDETDVRLDDWLKANQAEVTFNTFAEGSRVTLRKGKLISGEVVRIGKGKWFNEYDVLLDSGEIVTVSQMDIRAPKLI